MNLLLGFYKGIYVFLQSYVVFEVNNAFCCKSYMGKWNSLNILIVNDSEIHGFWDDASKSKIKSFLLI